MTLASLLVSGWLLFIALILAVLRVARRADDVTARQLAPAPLPASLPVRRRPLPLWRSLAAGLLTGAVAGVFAGSLIVNAVKPPARSAAPKPWLAPRPASQPSPPAPTRQPVTQGSFGGLAAPPEIRR